MPYIDPSLGPLKHGAPLAVGSIGVLQVRLPRASKYTIIVELAPKTR